jgi:sortase A
VTTHELDQIILLPSRAVRSRRRALMLGNLCLLAGIYLLLYVGGLYATEGYNRLAARGDTDLPPLVVSAGDVAPPAPNLQAPPPKLTPEEAEPAPFQPPVLRDTGQAVGSVPAEPVIAPSTISRIVIPSIKVDSKVMEVGWSVQEQDGQQVAVWDVAKYAVGHHRGSANPGTGGNVVLAGHVGGYGRVFRDLYYVRPGDQITLYSAGQQFLYVVEERLLVTEEGVSAEQRAENARYIGAYPYEVVTLITCWPASGPDKFSQRVIVRAKPYETEQSLSRSDETGMQTVR